MRLSAWSVSATTLPTLTANTRCQAVVPLPLNWVPSYDCGLTTGSPDGEITPLGATYLPVLADSARAALRFIAPHLIGRGAGTEILTWLDDRSRDFIRRPGS